jgi:hypothetical protein
VTFTVVFGMEALLFLMAGSLALRGGAGARVLRPAIGRPA